MSEKKVTLLKCGLRVFGAYTVINFLWTAILSIGITAASENAGTNATSVTMNGIGAFADRMVASNAIIALFSVVFGFSFLVFEAKSMSSQAKRALHIAVNYAVSMLCIYLLHSTAPEASASAWIVLLFFATFAFFAIYGASALVAFLIKRKKR